MKPDDIFVLEVRSHTKPGCEDEYYAFVQTILDEMRKEPTFINTVCHRDPEDPTSFFMYETWIDREDFFENQMKKPYRLAYEARLPELLRKPREVKVWEPLRGDFIFQNGPRQTRLK